MNETIQTILLSMGTTLLTNATSNAKNPARAVDDIMTLVGFEKIHRWAEKQRIKSAADIHDFKVKIADEITQIVLDNLQDPKLNILGPALEAAKYHIENEEMREMFAKLIASDMDKSKDHLVHPAFVDIIKQLSPLDAQNLALLFHSPYTSLPVANYYAVYKNGGKRLKQPNVFVSNDKEKLLDKLSSSLENLRRAGLVEITYKEVKLQDEQYAVLMDNNFLREVRKHLQETEPEFESVFIEKGLIRLTFFGLDFCEICLR